MGADVRTLDVFAEVFNLLDRANFTNPSGDRRLPTFLVLNGLVAGGFPRQTAARGEVRFLANGERRER